MLGIGPSPFFPVEPKLYIIIPSISIASIGYATIIISSFARAHAAAVDAGYVNNVKSNVIVAGKICQRKFSSNKMYQK